MNTRQVNIGGVKVGGGASVKVQSMCTVRTSDVEGTLRQIESLYRAGCEIVRVSVLDADDAKAIKDIKVQSPVPVVADIHFSHKLAIAAVESGCDKVRINPGNIGGEREIKLVADCIKAHKIPVRVGANTGSINKDFLAKYGRSAEALVESALQQAGIFQKYGVEDIVLSVKASDAETTYRAYTYLAKRCEFPLHIGVTEAGTEKMALAKSYSSLGALLLDGIGDTLRISVTGDPVKEVYAAHNLLRAVGLEKDFVDVVSCPTCGRCMWDCAALAEKVGEVTAAYRKPLKVAVMGCVVNGPGEAADCDIGIAGGDGYCVIFKKGSIIKKVASADAEREFFSLLTATLNDSM